MIWNNEQLPQQWNEGIICPVYKKDDRLIYFFKCNQQDAMLLLGTLFNVFAALNIFGKVRLCSGRMPRKLPVSRKHAAVAWGRRETKECKLKRCGVQYSAV
jgi:hypothetical protein